MGSLKELAIPPPKIDLQYSLHFWSYRVMYGCIQVPVCVWWQLGKKRFYIRPSRRVSEINLFWGFFCGILYYVYQCDEVSCFRGIILPVCWIIMTMLAWNIISIFYIYIYVLFDVLLFVIVLIIIVFTVEMKFSI